MRGFAVIPKSRRTRLSTRPSSTRLATHPMQPGVGAWVRVRDGRVVKRDSKRTEDGEGDDFVPVPTIAIVRHPLALERFSEVSALGMDRQSAILVHEGRALTLDNLTDAKLLVRARRMQAYMIPSLGVADKRSRLLALTDEHVAEIFGEWALAAAKLAAWNESIVATLALCPGAWAEGRSMASVAVQLCLSDACGSATTAVPAPP